MHYDSRAFSMNGRTTIARKNGDTRLGNTRGLGTKDIQQAQLLYCKTKPTDDPPTLKPTTHSPEGNIECLILVARDRDRGPLSMLTKRIAGSPQGKGIPISVSRQERFEF